LRAENENMRLVVRAFPVLPGKEPDVDAFARELAGPRQAEAHEFYRGLGVRRESWHFQPGPSGSQVIVVTEIDDLEPAARQYADAQQPFHRWFKEQVLRISTVDPNLDPLGPLSHPIFSWPPTQAPER
jgi:hypothetical protein